MIKLGNTEISLGPMGQFQIDGNWIHREAVKETYEMIYMVKGVVYLQEEDIRYELKKGDVVVLRPRILHKGYRESSGEVSFYWVHFYLNRDGDETEHKETFYLHNYTNTALFKELLHYGSSPGFPEYMKESVFAHILTEITTPNIKNSPIASNVYEWIRINAAADISAESVAERFGYSASHLSRIVFKQYGMTLKKLVYNLMLIKANDYLLNTSMSVKEISGVLKFSSPNAFINFYKYHKNTTPTKFRNSYYNIKLNNK